MLKYVVCSIILNLLGIIISTILKDYDYSITSIIVEISLFIISWILFIYGLMNTDYFILRDPKLSKESENPK